MSSYHQPGVQADEMGRTCSQEGLGRHTTILLAVQAVSASTFIIY